MDSKPYTFEEAYKFGNGFPDRGMRCYKCNALIPQFSNFGKREKYNWNKIRTTQGDEAANDYIMSITGCNLRWAKIWRIHPNGPAAKTYNEAKFDKSTSCPFCEKALRTKEAKQCPHCFKSWRG